MSPIAFCLALCYNTTTRTGPPRIKVTNQKVREEHWTVPTGSFFLMESNKVLFDMNTQVLSTSLRMSP